jgi:hypothetical protein
MGQFSESSAYEAVRKLVMKNMTLVSRVHLFISLQMIHMIIEPEYSESEMVAMQKDIRSRGDIRKKDEALKTKDEVLKKKDVDTYM